MAARLLLLAVLVWDCSALLLGAGTPRHFVARDTVKRRGATVQMDLSSLVSDHPLAAIAVTAAISSAAGTALGVSAIPSRASPVATVAAYSKIEDEAKDTEVCPRLRHVASSLRPARARGPHDTTVHAFTAHPQLSPLLPAQCSRLCPRRQRNL